MLQFFCNNATNIIHINHFLEREVQKSKQNLVTHDTDSEINLLISFTPTKRMNGTQAELSQVVTSLTDYSGQSLN